MADAKQRPRRPPRQKTPEELQDARMRRFQVDMLSCFSRHGVTGAVTYAQLYDLESCNCKEIDPRHTQEHLTQAKAYIGTTVFAPTHPCPLGMQASYAELMMVLETLHEGTPNEEALRDAFFKVRQRAAQAGEKWSPEALVHRQDSATDARVVFRPPPQRDPEFDN